MSGDREVCLLAEVLQEWRDSAFLELHDDTTVGADQVVMVPIGGGRTDIGMAAIGPMQAIKHSVVDEEIERAEHGGAANSSVISRKLLQQLVGGKRPIRPVDRVHELAARACQTVAGLL